MEQPPDIMWPCGCIVRYFVTDDERAGMEYSGCSLTCQRYLSACERRDAAVEQGRVRLDSPPPIADS